MIKQTTFISIFCQFIKNEPAGHDRQEVWPGGMDTQICSSNYFTNNVIFIRVCENNMNDFITFCTDV